MLAQGAAERRRPRSGTLGTSRIDPSPGGAVETLAGTGIAPAFRRPSRADPILASRPRVSRGTTGRAAPWATIPRPLQGLKRHLANLPIFATETS